MVPGWVAVSVNGERPLCHTGLFPSHVFCRTRVRRGRRCRPERPDAPSFLLPFRVCSVCNALRCKLCGLSFRGDNAVFPRSAGRAALPPRVPPFSRAKGASVPSASPARVCPLCAATAQAAARLSFQPIFSRSSGGSACTGGAALPPVSSFPLQHEPCPAGAPGEGREHTAFSAGQDFLCVCSFTI